MKLKETIKSILKEQKISQYMLAERLGERYEKVNHLINYGNPKLNTLMKWLRVVNCDLIIRTPEGTEYRVGD